MTPFLPRALLALSAGLLASCSTMNNVGEIENKAQAKEQSDFQHYENESLIRLVRIHLQEVTIQRDNTEQAGLQWQALLNSGGRGKTANLTRLADPLGSTKNAATHDASVGPDPWASSGITLAALSQLGRIVRTTDKSFLVQNRRSITSARHNTFSYVKNLELTNSSTNASAPSLTLQQEDITVGTSLSMVPDAQDDGPILLTVAYNITRLVSLENQQVGDPANPLFVQQPKISSTSNILQVELRPGLPSLIADTSQTIDLFATHHLDKDMSMLPGGSDANQEQQLVTLLIVTAIPEEGL